MSIGTIIKAYVYSGVVCNDFETTRMTKRSSFNYLTPTLKFSIAGFILPSIGALIFLGLQMALSSLGLECTKSMKILWTFTVIGVFVTPYLFARLINKRLNEGFNLTSKEVTFFNLAEYFFVQCSLVPLFTTSKTLCYVGDGQNGLEFVFTGWMAIPALIILSLLFDQFRKSKIEELKASKFIESSAD